MPGDGAAIQPMIELRKVAKSYGSVAALHETSLSVVAGEFLTLLGPSGSGKTTLLNMISGMASPTVGEIRINGRDVTSVPAEKRRIGMVFQNYALMPHMTVFDNIAFPLEIRRVPRAEIRRRVTAVLEQIRLPDIGGRKPRELSGGQQQRVSIARCIVYEPNLILMDEPLGALDKKLREQMQLEIKRIHEELGVTILYVTHDQEEALNMSDRIMLLNGGKVEQLGTPDEIYFRPASRFAADFIGASTLLDATIVEMGATAVAQLGPGRTCELPAVAPARQGASGQVMIRPESVRLLAGGPVPPGHNALTGRLSNTLSAGATVKHFVTLDGGEIMIAQEMTRPDAGRFDRGEPVVAAWPIGATRFLDR